MSKKPGKTKAILVIVLCVLIIGLCAGVLTFLEPELLGQNNKTSPSTSLKTGDYIVDGVTIGGLDVGNMKVSDAQNMLSTNAARLTKNVKISVKVSDKTYTYTAADFGISLDVDASLIDAVNFKPTADKKTADYDAAYKIDTNTVKAKLTADTAKFNIAPADASFVFSPWGFTASDNAPYNADKNAIIKACSSGKMPSRPELVPVAQADMPNKLRYEYWQNKKYIPDYIPEDATVARFQYKPEVTGYAVDIDALVSDIVKAVQGGDFSVITAPGKATEPNVKLADLKAQTQLVDSWTSSYSKHPQSSRIWNVAKLSGIVNGVVIQPGETWSINKEAGPRSVARGWKNAAGIENGGYVDQPGGGVCQISSTTYNASIRAGLQIVESKHHSIKSNYIPGGLDATISTGGPDLKIKNTNTAPVYIVSYMNPKAKNVTVEIYGQPVVDSKSGPVILRFTSKSIKHYGNPTQKTIYNTSVCPETENSIPAGKSCQYATPQRGEIIQVFKKILSLDGKELKVSEFGDDVNITPINGRTYVNGPDPKTVKPSPSHSPTPSPPVNPSPSPSPSPAPPVSSAG